MPSDTYAPNGISIIIVAMAPCLIAPAAIAHPRMADPDKCICSSARVANGWCGKCAVGYVAGMPIKSAMLYDEIDPHGHKIDTTKIKCGDCATAVGRDAYCETCHIGFIDGQAYMSKLAYQLARGRPISLERRACVDCRSLKVRHRWCEKCNTGFVGSFSYADRRVFDAARAALGIVEAAIQKLSDCRVCAAAIVCHGYCTKCRIQYRDGKEIQEVKPTEAPPSGTRSTGQTDRSTR